jgi:hypothetical protein
MKARTYKNTFATIALALLVAAVAVPQAVADGPVVVDLATCDRPLGEGGGGGGSWSVPAGVPVTVSNLDFLTGTHGLAVDFLHHQSTITGSVRGGVPDVVDATNAWSAPQQFDPGARHPGSITSLPDIELTPLSPGESVLVGTLITFTGPVQIAFPPVGQVNFGPFHIVAGDEFGALCLITAV